MFLNKLKKKVTILTLVDQQFTIGEDFRKQETGLVESHYNLRRHIQNSKPVEDSILKASGLEVDTETLNTKALAGFGVAVGMVSLLVLFAAEKVVGYLQL